MVHRCVYLGTTSTTNVFLSNMFFIEASGCLRFELMAIIASFVLSIWIFCVARNTYTYTTISRPPASIQYTLYIYANVHLLLQLTTYAVNSYLLFGDFALHIRALDKCKRTAKSPYAASSDRPACEKDK